MKMSEIPFSSLVEIRAFINGWDAAKQSPVPKLVANWYEHAGIERGESVVCQDPSEQIIPDTNASNMLPIEAETAVIPITFGAIVNGLVEGTYPVGRRFKTSIITDSSEMIYAEVFEDGVGNKGLRWENGETVQLDADVISDPWFIELDFSSEFKQLEFQEEESDTSMVATVFDDGSATVEITEEGIGETMIGLTQQQVQQLQELLLYKADN